METLEDHYSTYHTPLFNHYNYAFTFNIYFYLHVIFSLTAILSGILDLASVFTFIFRRNKSFGNFLNDDGFL